METQKFFSTKQENVEHVGHLERGVMPIRACIMDRPINYTDEEKSLLKKIEQDAEFIDWHGNEHMFYKANNREKGEPGEWVISGISEKDKYSRDFWNCTGVVAIGTRKSDGKQLSIMTHQNPESFLNDEKKFTADLSGSLIDLRELCKPNTVDMVIFGGNSHNEDSYIRAINLLNKIGTDSLGFSPQVITGPDFTNSGAAHVCIDTQNRRLYFSRPEQKFNELNQDFKANEVEDRVSIKDWLRWRGLL